MRIKTYSKDNKKIHEIGYDSRTGLEHIFKSLDNLIELEQDLNIHIVPQNIIPSIERTINDFELFESNIKKYLKDNNEQDNNFNISFSNNWEKYCDIKINKNKINKNKKEPLKIETPQFNTFNILEKSKPKDKIDTDIQSSFNKDVLEKQILENNDNTETILKNNEFLSLEKPIRCGFEEIHEENVILNTCINKSGVLKNNGHTTLVMQDNNGSINVDNGVIIFSSGVLKGTIIFNKTNITESLPENEACVVFLSNNEIVIKKL